MFHFCNLQIYVETGNQARREASFETSDPGMRCERSRARGPRNLSVGSTSSRSLLRVSKDRREQSPRKIVARGEGPLHLDSVMRCRREDSEEL